MGLNMFSNGRRWCGSVGKWEQIDQMLPWSGTSCRMYRVTTSNLVLNVSQFETPGSNGTSLIFAPLLVFGPGYLLVLSPNNTPKLLSTPASQVPPQKKALKKKGPPQPVKGPLLPHATNTLIMYPMLLKPPLHMLSHTYTKEGKKLNSSAYRKCILYKNDTVDRSYAKLKHKNNIHHHTLFKNH